MIEELGEWIVHAFDRYGTKPAEVKVQGSGVESVSETETDDAGITFMARRGSPPQRSEKGSSSDGTLIETTRRESTAGTRKHVISESELMRRRRLLDSYIFE